MKALKKVLVTLACCAAVQTAEVNGQNLQKNMEAAVSAAKSLDELKDEVVNDLAFHLTSTNQTELLRKITDELGFDKRSRQEDGSTLLHVAARFSANETLEWLIDSGVDVDVENDAHFTPMCVAAIYGQDRSVVALFGAGANLNGTFPAGRPLVLAAMKNHDSTVKLLLAKGADPDIVDANGETPLHHAVRAANPVIVRALIDSGASRDVKNNKDETPVTIARSVYNKKADHDEKARDWGTEQVYGPPNSSNGDSRRAWASKSRDGQEEWLVVEYEKAVIARQFEIYENLGPNAVHRITWFDGEGKEHEAWSGTDPAVPNKKGVHVAKIDVDVPKKSNRYKIYIDSVNVPDWNEIDAVGLISEEGKQWVSWAEASTCYAKGEYRGNSARTVWNILKQGASEDLSRERDE